MSLEEPSPEAGAGPLEAVVRPRLFEVEITIVAVVQAENEDEAHEVAREEYREIAGDVWEPDITVNREVKKLDDLRDGWDGMCLPYGGDGATRLDELL